MARKSTATSVDDDPVAAEYNVYLTPPMQEQIFMLQYPNRPRGQPYNSATGGTPREMRIKPRAGYMEVDVNLNSDQNFNKFMSLKWGDAIRTSKEIHNTSGTYGPASGLASAKSRALLSGRSKPLASPGERDEVFEREIYNFKAAEAEGRVFSTQTLGGQIIRHDGVEEAGKANYFAGAFRGDTIHLTKITGTVQMRPQFHHLDAEDERNRLAGSRAQAADAESGPAPAGHAIRQRIITDEEKKSAEHRIKQLLKATEQEQWLQMSYIDEEAEEAYEAFRNSLFVKDVSVAPTLKSNIDRDQYLDAISVPRHQSPSRRKKRSPKQRISNDELAGKGDREEKHQGETDEEA